LGKNHRSQGGSAMSVQNVYKQTQGLREGIIFSSFHEHQLFSRVSREDLRYLSFEFSSVVDYLE
jgi:phosphosulfolactate phosphohydrolase-like enzyme